MTTAHLIESTVGVIGLAGVFFGSLCVFRIGKHNECGPGTDRLSSLSMIGGSLAFAGALFAYSWLW